MTAEANSTKLDVARIKQLLWALGPVRVQAAAVEGVEEIV